MFDRRPQASSGFMTGGVRIVLMKVYGCQSGDGKPGCKNVTMYGLFSCEYFLVDHTRGMDNHIIDEYLFVIAVIYHETLFIHF
jgi:hypothetical protein